MVKPGFRFFNPNLSFPAKLIAQNTPPDKEVLKSMTISKLIQNVYLNKINLISVLRVN